MKNVHISDVKDADEFVEKSFKQRFVMLVGNAHILTFCCPVTGGVWFPQQEGTDHMRMCELAKKNGYIRVDFYYKDALRLIRHRLKSGKNVEARRSDFDFWMKKMDEKLSSIALTKLNAFCKALAEANISYMKKTFPGKLSIS